MKGKSRLHIQLNGVFSYPGGCPAPLKDSAAAQYLVLLDLYRVEIAFATSQPPFHSIRKRGVRTRLVARLMGGGIST